MKGWKIALWAGIIAAALALLGVWGFAWYYFIFLGKGRDTGGGGFAVYEEALLEPGKTISLFLDQSDFLVNEPEEANLTILCGQEITGEVTVTDEQGNVVCQVENNGSGRLSASVPIAESEARIGGFTAEADGEKSNTASFYVLPEVTEEMFLRLDGVAKDLEDFLLDEEFKDPYGKEAFERITEHLEKDERVAAVAENNQVILFQTVDNLMGSYGMGRKEGLTFGSGFSDKDEVYEKWRRQQDVRGDMIDSGIPITNDKIYHYSPYDTDEIISSSYQAFVEREKRLADKLGMEQLSFVGSEARKWMKEGDFLDCGFWVFNTHGLQLERSDGSNMLFFALGEVDEGTMLDMLDEDNRRKGYQHLWGKMKGDEQNEKLVGPDSYRMVYDVSSDKEGSTVNREIWGSTRYLEYILGNRTFDNTVVYFAICYGYSDPDLRDLLCRHGASAFIGCNQPLSGGMALAVLEQMINIMGEKDRNGNGGSLQMAMETSMERTIRAMLNDLLKDESAEERRESWEFLQSEMQNNPMRYTASGVKRQRIFEGRTVLEGFVVDPEGEGIQGAKVTAHHWLNHRFEEEESATTDSDGKYTLKVPRGIYGITAEKAMGSNGVKMKGHATVQAGKEGEDAGEIVLGLAELSGTVKDEETMEPVAGASVQWQSGRTASSVFSGSDGTFLISDLIPGDYELRVSKDGYQDKNGIGVEVEMGATTVLLDDILMKRELNYYRFIRDELLPQMGYASTESASQVLTYETASQYFGWDKRSGLLSANIADFDGDGTEDLVVCYFQESPDTYSGGRTLSRIYASLYSKNEQEIYPINTVDLSNPLFANGFHLLQAGVMWIEGRPYLYVESNSNAYFADGGSFSYTWYGYDGRELRPYWMVGKTDGGSSGIADSLLTYSDAQNYTKQVLWADSEYLRYNGGAALAGSNWANRMDGIKTGFSLLGLPEPAIGTDYDGYGDGGGQYPTYWRENYLEKTFRYRCAGTGSYMRRDMQVIVSDESRLKEHIEALGGK